MKMETQDVPRSLRIWFVIHFAADMLFGIPILLAPNWILPLFGWDVIDPFMARIVGAALMGIGIESLLGRNASAEAFRATIDNTMFPPGVEDLEERRRAYTISGIQVRDAPNAIVICTEKSFLELPLPLMAIGIMAQTICLAAMAHGLGTCIMGRPVEMPALLRDLLDIPPAKVIMLVVAMGYPDLEKPINNLERQRAPLEELVHWCGC